MEKVPGFSGHVTRNQAKKRKLDEKLDEQEESTVDDMQNLTLSETALNDDNDALSNNLEHDELPVDDDPRVVVVNEEIDLVNEMDEGDDRITGPGQQDAVFQSASSEPNLPSTFMEDFKTQLDLCCQQIRSLTDRSLDKDVRITDLSLQLKSAQAEIQRIKDLIPGVPTDCGPADEVANTNENEKDERAEALLPFVVEVYWKWLAKNQKNRIKNLNFKCQKDDHGIQVLKREDDDVKNLELKCRLVCKQWKTAIDLVLAEENTPMKNIRTKVTFSNGHANKCREELTQVLNAYKNTDMSLCPFPPRILVIIEKKRKPNRNKVIQWRKIIQCFLWKYGDYVEEFQYYGDNEMLKDAYLSQWHKNLTYWIKMMPNLKRLTMRNSLISSLDPFYSTNLFKDMDRRLRSSLFMKPFPGLPKLESLVVEHIPTLFTILVLAPNDHLRRIRCHAPAINFHLKRKIFYSNLRSLSCYARGNMSLDEFTLGPEWANSLEHLELDYTNCFMYGDFFQEFAFAQRFGRATLQSLHIKITPCWLNMGNVLKDYNKPVHSLIMPNLKKVAVTFSDPFKEHEPISFYLTEKLIVKMLSTLKSLENLTLYNLNSRKLGWEQDTGKLKRWELKRLLRIGMVSKLFGLLPVLNKVEIQLASKSDDTPADGNRSKSFSFLRLAATNNVTLDEKME